MGEHESRAASQTATFELRIREMVGAAERGDGAGVRACFTDDGVYHDVFYGRSRAMRLRA